MAMSASVSPLNSPTTIAEGLLPVGSVLPLMKRPNSEPRQIVTVSAAVSRTARSGRSSPSKSPWATAVGAPTSSMGESRLGTSPTAAPADGAATKGAGECETSERQPESNHERDATNRPSQNADTSTA